MSLLTEDLTSITNQYFKIKRKQLETKRRTLIFLLRARTLSVKNIEKIADRVSLKREEEKKEIHQLIEKILEDFKTLKNNLEIYKFSGEITEEIKKTIKKDIGELLTGLEDKDD